jgi:DNA-binding NtrC family response regulator
MHLVNCKNFDGKTNKRAEKLSVIAERNQDSSIFQQAKKAAGFDNLSILITGETGTGKEALAHFIHDNSLRAERPFIIADLSTIPEHLIKGELFGYKKGSFTGATDNHIGLIKEANGGTIFLDEIGNIPLDIQTALLRFLDYGEIKTSGVSKLETVDVKVIAATNADLLSKIEFGQFREDLYNRLCGFPIHLTPLREKPKSEIKDTLEFLIADAAKDFSKNKIEITGQAWDFLLNYKYSGNYREARNIVERFYVVGKNLFDIEDILPLITLKDSAHTFQASNEITEDYKFPLNEKEITINDFTIDELVALKVGITFAQNNGVKNQTAKELDIDYKTLNKHLATFKSMGKIPNVIGINPTPDWKNSKSNFQKR